jgi:Domain of unknown function (DUF4145)
MPRFDSLQFRSCGWCGVGLVGMRALWSDSHVASTDEDRRSWATYACPRCGGVTLVEVRIVTQRQNVIGPSIAIEDQNEVVELQALPTDGHQRYKVGHLPEDVARFLADAVRVLDSGVPDAAAVQLRRTLEAAAAHHDIRRRNLVASIQELMSQGKITQDFGEALDYIRKIGNIGAHYTDSRLSRVEAEQALRFTVQFLRNLFEVPGELKALRAEEPDDRSNNSAPTKEPDQIVLQEDDPKLPTAAMRLGHPRC